MLQQKIVFMGSADISREYLKSLLENQYNIIAVYTQPPRKKNRGMEVTKSPVQLYAEEKNINIQYFVVELLSAFTFVLIYYFYGLSITSFLLIILSIFFIIIFFIDLKHYIIPDRLTYPLMIIGFIKSFYPNLNLTIFPNFINSLIGGICGYLIIWSIIFFYKKFRKKEGMGLGDAKLLAAIGFWFGWLSIPFIIFTSSIVALLIVLPSVVNKTRKMSSQIPFGPYIIIGCLVYISLINLEILKLI